MNLKYINNMSSQDGTVVNEEICEEGAGSITGLGKYSTTISLTILGVLWVEPVFSVDSFFPACPHKLVQS